MTVIFTIDRKDGTLRLGDMRLHPFQYEADIRTALSTLISSENDMSNGYKWLNIKNLSFGSKPASLSLCFHNSRFTQASWAVDLDNSRVSGTWPTRKAMETEIKFVRKELSRQLGWFRPKAQAELPWGAVWSIYDGKSYTASHGLRYIIKEENPMSVNQTYIRQTVQPGESITTNARLHWIGYASGILLPLLGWLATYYVPAIAMQPWAKWVMLGSLLLSAALLYLAHVEQATSEVVITDSRLIGSVGHAVNRLSFDLPFKDIHGINVTQSALGRLCGYGTVTVEHNKDMTTSIGDIDAPLQFQQKLLSALRAAKDTTPTSIAA